LATSPQKPMKTKGFRRTLFSLSHPAPLL